MTIRTIGAFIAVTVGMLGLAALGFFYAPQLLSYDEAPRTNANIPPAEAPSMQTVKAYFGNSNLNPGAMDCAAVYPVDREVAKTPQVGRAAILELLKGPRQDEKNGGYYTSLNEGVKLNSLSIKDGVARVDFGAKMEEGMGGSCRVAAVRSQVTKTLMQFPTVKSVVISVDGRTEDILQP
jgi:spore germination protein GerM